MWKRWRDRWAPNCPLVLQSMVPSLVNKVLCSAPFFIIVNLQALIEVCGYKSYLWAWWWLTIHAPLCHFNLPSKAPLYLVKR